MLALLREAGMTTIFGNPGSNELPFIADLPPDFRYISALQEAAVVGIADGYAQASGIPGVLSLHAAAGTGHGMGALANAATSKTPLVVIAGQQARAMIPSEAMLTIPEPGLLVAPFSRWSAQPARAQDVPSAVARAIHRCQLPSPGPTFLSVPLDDWGREPDQNVGSLSGRKVHAGARPPGELVQLIARKLSEASSPAFVVGGEGDTDIGFAAAVAVAEAWGLPTYAGAETYRLGFPSAHPLFRRSLPIGRAEVAEVLAEHDFVLVAGAQAFRYHKFQAGPFLPEGTEVLSITNDADQAAYTQFGDTVLADVSAALADLAQVAQVAPEPSASYSGRRPPRAPAEPGEAPFSSAHVLDVLNAAQPPGTAYILEAPSIDALFLSRVDTDAPRSFYTPAAGGLGFGLPAAVGVALAEKGRPVVGVIGDGSAQYGITALWTAAQEQARVTICYLRNGSYEALRQFSAFLGAQKAPALDLPDIDIVSIAKGYGVQARTITTSAELAEALRSAQSAPGPVLLDIPVRD